MALLSLFPFLPPVSPISSVQFCPCHFHSQTDDSLFYFNYYCYKYTYRYEDVYKYRQIHKYN